MLSRRNARRFTSQLEKTATHPATTVVTNIPAPTFAPTPISVIPERTEIISEKTSGAPLPKARKVTPKNDQEDNTNTSNTRRYFQFFYDRIHNYTEEIIGGRSQQTKQYNKNEYPKHREPNMGTIRSTVL